MDAANNPGRPIGNRKNRGRELSDTTVGNTFRADPRQVLIVPSFRRRFNSSDHTTFVQAGVRRTGLCVARELGRTEDGGDDLLFGGAAL